MISYTKARRYLESFINYERLTSFRYNSFKLKRMAALAESLGIKLKNSRVIHIAGTKGKGSTAHFCAYILASSGYKTGLYTSPHFFDFRERIKIVERRGGKPERLRESKISRKEVMDITFNLQNKLKKTENPLLQRVSFFEVYTALALRYFMEREVDFIVLETGLGGRLDATNIVKPAVSIITPVGYDHMDKLGYRLEEIAYEKAGIIKRKVPVVCSLQRPQALKIIKRQCRLKDNDLYIEGRDFTVSGIKLTRRFTNFDFSFGGLRLANMKIKLKGKNQIQNSACALAALCVLKNLGLLHKNIRYGAGALNCSLPGRFEILKKDPLIIVDIAHNEASFKSLRENLKIYFPEKKVIFIFACSKDKLPAKMLKNIRYSELIFTSFSSPRSYDPFLLSEKFPHRCFVAPSPEKAISEAVRLYTNDSLILISGSFFLVSEAKKIILGRCREYAAGRVVLKS
ncbi:MAG: hypothetical protein GF375_02535 [Candidatus Omnitrophica bacterium]|nr:hypothetical protein [Candidatus Omnitrophota bacterium]MBD3268978.1 hypothetical protein [Candidatus Omnitrophota bacterium]